ncbi:MAG: hypothetical protein HY077_06605 [Elusimicrobia bacterium]|nr:hypothetical protein [Elusimicrobiota bacterium]
MKLSPDELKEFAAGVDEMEAKLKRGPPTWIESENLDGELEKLEQKAEELEQKSSGGPEHWRKVRQALLSLRPKMVPADCMVPPEYRKELFTELRWREFTGLFKKAMYDENGKYKRFLQGAKEAGRAESDVGYEAPVVYDGWNCMGGTFVHVDPKTRAKTDKILSIPEVIALWKQVRESDEADAMKKEVKSLRTAMDRVKEKYLKGNVWQDSKAAGADLDPILAKMNQHDLEALAKADPKTFGSVVADLNQVLGKMPQEIRKGREDSFEKMDAGMEKLASSDNAQLQELMKMTAPPPVDRGSGPPPKEKVEAPKGPGLIADLRATLRGFLSGEKEAFDRARTTEWLTYNAQKRESAKKRAKTAWDLSIELDLYGGLTNSGAAFIKSQYFDGQKLPGVEQREMSLANFVVNIDGLVDDSKNKYLVRYRELSRGIKEELDPEKRAPLQRERAALLRDRPTIERYFAERMGGEVLDGVARERGLGAYQPSVKVTDSTAEIAKKLGGRFRLPGSPPGGTYNGKGAAKEMSDSFSKLKTEFQEADVYTTAGMLDYFLEKLRDEAEAGNGKAKEDYGYLEPSVRRFKDLLASVEKLKASKDPDELEGMVRLLSEVLGLSEQETSRSLASWHMKNFEREEGSKYGKTPDTRSDDEKAAALRKARWKAVSAKVDSLLKQAKDFGSLNGDEYAKYREEFPDAFLRLTAGLKESEAKAELLRLEAENPGDFYLLTERMAHLRGSHRSAVFDSRSENGGWAVKGFDDALSEIAKRPPESQSPSEPPIVRSAKFVLLASLAAAFPEAGELAKRQLMAAGESASISKTISETDVAAQKYLGSDEAGRRKLADLQKLKDRALKEDSDFSGRSQATLDYLKALREAIHDSPAFEQVRAIEGRIAKEREEFDGKRKALADELAKSPVMAQWQERVKALQKARGDNPVSQEEAMSLLGDLLTEENVKTTFKGLADLVQQNRERTAQLAQQLGDFLENHPEAAQVQSSLDAFSNYLLQYAAAGNAPPGSWELETAAGKVTLETAQKDGRPVEFAVDDDAPYLLRRNYFGQGPIKGYRIITESGEVFSSADGKLVVKTTREGGVTHRTILINGVPAGTTEEAADPKDPTKTQKKVAHVLPGFKDIQEVKTGNAERDMAQVRLDDLMGIEDPKEFERAVRARAREIASYLRRASYMSDMREYVEKPEDWWDDSNVNSSHRDGQDRNPRFFDNEDAEHLYYFLAHRIQDARHFKNQLSLDLQKDGTSRKVRIIETGASGTNVYSSNISPFSAPSAGDGGEWEVEAASMGPDGRGLGAWRMSYRRAKGDKESGYKWIMTSTMDHYVSKEVYPFGIAVDNKSGDWDSEAGNVPPWEAFATHYGTQSETDVYGILSDGKAEQVKLYTTKGHFHKDMMADHFFMSALKEGGKGVGKFGESIWYGAVGTGKILISPLAGDSYFVEGMSNFAENPLSQATDHWIDVAKGRKGMGDFHEEDFGKRVYQALPQHMKDLGGGVSYDAFKLSAQTSYLLYDMGSRQQNIFAKSGLYAAGMFIDFGKGTVESMPLMFAGHFTSGLMRSVGFGKNAALSGGELVNSALGKYFLVQTGVGLVQLPGQLVDFAKDTSNPEKAQAFFSNASGMLVNLVAFKMMEKPAVERGPWGGPPEPPTGIKKVMSKFHFIEGSGLEISANARNIWGLDTGQFVGGRRTASMNARVESARAALKDGKTKDIDAFTEGQLKALDAMEKFKSGDEKSLHNVDEAAGRKDDITKTLLDGGFSQKQIDAFFAQGVVPEPATAGTVVPELFPPGLMKVLQILKEKNSTAGQKRDFLLKRPGAQEAIPLTPAEIAAIQRPGERTHMRTYQFRRAGDFVEITVTDIPIKGEKGPTDGVVFKDKVPVSESPLELRDGESLDHVLAIDKTPPADRGPPARTAAAAPPSTDRISDLVVGDAASDRARQNGDLDKIAGKAFPGEDEASPRRAAVDNAAAELVWKAKVPGSEEISVDALREKLNLKPEEVGYLIKKIASLLGVNRDNLAFDPSLPTFQQPSLASINSQIKAFHEFSAKVGDSVPAAERWKVFQELQFAAPEEGHLLSAVDQALAVEPAVGGEARLAALRRRVLEQYRAQAEPITIDPKAYASGTPGFDKDAKIVADMEAMKEQLKKDPSGMDLDWYLKRRTTPELTDFLAQHPDVGVRVYGGEVQAALRHLAESGYTEVSRLAGWAPTDIKKVVARNPKTGESVVAYIATSGDGVIKKQTARCLLSGIDPSRIEVFASKEKPVEEFRRILGSAEANPDVIMIGFEGKFEKMVKEQYNVRPIGEINSEGLQGKRYLIDGKEVLAVSINGNYIYNERAGELVKAALPKSDKPRAVIFLGIAGSLNHGIRKSDFVAPRTFAEISGAQAKPCPQVDNAAIPVMERMGGADKGIHVGEHGSVDTPLRETKTWMEQYSRWKGKDPALVKDVVEQELAGIVNAIGGDKSISLYSVLEISDVVGTKENLSQQGKKAPSRTPVPLEGLMKPLLDDALRRIPSDPSKRPTADAK